MTDRELMQQALEALEYAAERIGCPDDDDAIGVARKALRERLAQPEQSNGWVLREVLFDDGEPLGHRAPTPLTDEMRKQMKDRCNSHEMRGAFADGWLSAEAAHGIKGEA